jgi:DNA-binding MarR family transcriptional regulator
VDAALGAGRHDFVDTQRSYLHSPPGLQLAGEADVVPAHFSVLRYPGPGNRRPSDLAAEARMSKQAMNYLLGDLERLGYMTRDDDPDDGRSKRIQLTERGEALRQAIRKIVRGIEAEWERDLGARKFAQLRGLLQELNETGMVRDRPSRD